MKNLIAISLCLFSLAANAYDSGTHFGVQVGMNQASAAASPGGDTAAVTRWMAGLAVETPLVGSILFLQPELNFFQGGGENAVFGTLARTRLDYLELPVQAKLALNLGIIRPYALGGLTFGYLLGSGASDLNGNSIDTTNAFHRFDMGLAFGLGAGFNFPDEHELFVNVRYRVGITDDAAYAGDWRNRGFEIDLGMWL